MSLIDIEMPADASPVPDEVVDYLRDVDDRLDRLRNGGFDSVCGFVPSDFDLVYRALRTISDNRLAPGELFCEWGSGLGVVAGMASMLDYESCGIEIDRDLVEAADDLAEDFDLPVNFVCGNFIPTGGEELADNTGELAWLAMGGADGYDEMGLDIDDFDTIFAFPWPGEEHVVADIFDRYAAVGALLVTYHGMDGMRVRRKVAAEQNSGEGWQ